jgi:S1-C subfamily serine protease
MTINWIDIIILLILAVAFYSGVRIGFIALLFGFGGFFSGLFIGGWVFPHLLPIPNQTVLALVNGNLVLLFAALAAIRAYEFGEHLHVSMHGRTHIVESAAGVTLSVGSALLAVWLLAAGIGTLPFAGLSNSANDALIIQTLDRHLPAAPAVFEEFKPLIDPNSPVRVFVKVAPNSSIGGSPIATATPATVIKAGGSVVRITSFGCGGIVDGSGFVVAPGLVATNAHVIAGVNRPIIKSGKKSFAAKPVLFDPSQDLAILRVNGLSAKALRTVPTTLPANTAVYAIGYPSSIYTEASGIIISNQQTQGTNIYGIGSITRDVYVVKIHIDQGSSGGPIVTSAGAVAGIVFAKDDMANNIGYAMTLSSLMADIQRAEMSNTRVGTGACFAE